MPMISLYGIPVNVPELVELPLQKLLDTEPLVKARVGNVTDPDTEFGLDSAVRIAIKRHEVGVIPTRPLGARALEHYIVDHAIPNYLSYFGSPVLHGAGVSRGNSGFLLSGDSGVGKSTSCAWLASQGWRILGDDAIRVEQTGSEVMMWPSYPGCRLHEDVLGLLPRLNSESATLVAEYATKVRLDIGQSQFSYEPAPLRHWVMLQPPGDCNIHRIGAAELCAKMAGQLMHPPGHAANAIDRLVAMEAMAEKLDGWAIQFPRNRVGLEFLSSTLNDIAHDDTNP